MFDVGLSEIKAVLEELFGPKLGRLAYKAFSFILLAAVVSFALGTIWSNGGKEIYNWIQSISSSDALVGTLNFLETPLAWMGKNSYPLMLGFLVSFFVALLVIRFRRAKRKSASGVVDSPKLTGHYAFAAQVASAQDLVDKILPPKDREQIQKLQDKLKAAAVSPSLSGIERLQARAKQYREGVDKAISNAMERSDIGIELNNDIVVRGDFERMFALSIKNDEEGVNRTCRVKLENMSINAPDNMLMPFVLGPENRHRLESDGKFFLSPGESELTPVLYRNKRRPVEWFLFDRDGKRFFISMQPLELKVGVYSNTYAATVTVEVRVDQSCANDGSFPNTEIEMTEILYHAVSM